MILFDGIIDLWYAIVGGLYIAFALFMFTGMVVTGFSGPQYFWCLPLGFFIIGVFLFVCHYLQLGD